MGGGQKIVPKLIYTPGWNMNNEHDWPYGSDSYYLTPGLNESEGFDYWM